MSSSCMPARYGYQSARAGSQRWTWASTTRSIVMLRSSSLDVVHDAAQGAVDPRRQLGAAEGDRRLGVRVAAHPDPVRRRDQLGAGQLPGVVDADQVPHELADGRRSATRHRSPRRSRTHRSWRSATRCAARESCAAACARLRPPEVVASVTVTMRIGRPDSRAWSLTARTHATSLRMASVDPRHARRAPAPRRSPAPARRRTRLRATTTASIATCVARGLTELLGRARRSRSPARADADPDALDAPRRQRVAHRRLPPRVVGDDQARPGAASHPPRASARSRRTRPRTGRCWRRSSPARPRPARTPPGSRCRARGRASATSAVRATSSSARRRDRRHLGAVGEDDVPRAPRERVAAEVRADGAELLG